MKEGTGLELSWLEGILFGLISGLTEILPVSARAHRVLLGRLFGNEEPAGLMMLLLHTAVFAAVYLSSQKLILKMRHARRLARTPKKKRKRPLDIKSMMDSSFLRTMMVPVILAYLLYGMISKIKIRLIALAGLLVINGIILYIPQFFPSSNKDARSLSRLEGILMGVGGALGVLPGVSGIGASLTIGSICGVDRAYAVNMSLLMYLAASVVTMIFDVLAIVIGGLGSLSFLLLLRYILVAGAAFAGTMLAIRVLRSMAQAGWTIFAYYSWGLALFTFILNLMA